MPSNPVSPRSSYKPKQVISLAPDALIYINGSETLTTCVRCGKETKLVEDVTDISATISLEANASMNFTVVAPEYDEDRYVVNGKSILKILSEVEVYMRGRFLVNGQPRYYPVFWGIVTSTSESYSDGQNTIKVDCEGILRWWEMSKVNIQAALTAKQLLPSNTDISEYTNIFGEMNPFEIIWHLATVSTGGLMAPEGFTGEAFGESAIDTRVLQEADNDIIDYWRQRFFQVGKALRMFGWNGERYEPAFTEERSQADSDTRVSLVMNPPASRFTRPFDDSSIESDKDFKPFGQISQSYDIFASEITSKLEMATQVKNAVSFEFYQDSTGEIIFKPPFYNLDVSPYQPCVIEDVDIISFDLTESEAEVYTRVDVRGSMHDMMKDGAQEVQPYGFYADPNLIKKFGLRAHTISMGFLRNYRDCFFYAISELDRMNVRRFSGSLTIPGRPELRVGFPIYIRSKEEYFYVTSVSHSFSFGQTFTTTVGLEARRTRQYSEKDGSLLLDYIYAGEAVSGFSKGVFQLPDVEAEAIKDMQSRDKSSNVGINTLKPSNFITDPKEISKDVLNTLGSVNTMGSSCNSFKLKRDPSIYRVTREDNGLKVKVPHTDSKGFEVIGGFPYGRRLVVKANGDIVRSAGTEDGEKFVASLFNAVDGSSYKTGGQSLQFSDSAEVNSRILNMTPHQFAGDGEKGTKMELGDYMDSLTLESGKKAVSRESKGSSTESLLNIDPGLRNPAEESQCSCGRLDKDLDPIIERTEDNFRKNTRHLNSTQGDIKGAVEQRAEVVEKVSDTIRGRGILDKKDFVLKEGIDSQLQKAGVSDQVMRAPFDTVDGIPINAAGFPESQEFVDLSDSAFDNADPEGVIFEFQRY